MVAAIMMTPSRRERIQQILMNSRNELSAKDIAALLGEKTDPDSIYEDIEHIAKSVNAESKGKESVIMFPPKCRACGFVFKGLEKPKRPGKCPKCRSEWIAPPLFRIAKT